MKKYIAILTVFVVGALFAQTPKARQLQLSQAASVTQTIGVTDVSITYHRPGVKGRKVFGDLEPLGKVWRAGANEATVFSFSTDVMIDGTTLKAGRYSFFLIPTNGDWTVIFNTVADQWGAFRYDSSKDALRFTVKPAVIPNEEWLSYSFSDLSSNSATVTMKWSTVAISFKIMTNTGKNVMDLANAFSSAAEQQNKILTRYTYDSLALAAQTMAVKGMVKEALKAGEDAMKMGKNAGLNTGELESWMKEWKKK